MSPTLSNRCSCKPRKINNRVYLITNVDHCTEANVFTYSDIDADSGKPELAYELANQWLIHIVTPQWWDDFIITDMLGNFLLHYTFDKVSMRRRNI